MHLNSLHASLSAPCALALLAALGSSACGDCSGASSNNDTPGTSVLIEVESFVPEYAFAEQASTLTFSLIPSAPEAADSLSWRVDFGDGERLTGEGLAEQMASHTYPFSGAFTVEISALRDGDVVGSTTLERTIYDPIDVALAGARAQPANVDAGDVITVSAVLSNQLASDLLVPVPVRVALSAERDVSPEGAAALDALTDVVISPASPGLATLEAGQQRELSIEAQLPADLPSGDYYVTVIADAEGALVDASRQDNLTTSSSALRVLNVSQIEPDLIVTSVLAAPDRAFPELNTFSRSASLQNAGGLDLFDVVVETYLSVGDNELSPEDRLVHTSAPIAEISARGGEVDLDPVTIVLDEAITPPAQSALDVYVILKAFSRDDVTEGDLDNNVLAAEIPILVTDQPVNGPDIAVLDFTLSPERTFINGSLNYALEVANEGTEDVPSFLCRIYLAEAPRIDTSRDQPLESINVTAMTSGEQRALQGSLLVSELFDPGLYYMYVLCDPNDLLNEPFRSNNSSIYASPIQISDQSDVDLSVRSFTVPKMAAEGEELSFLVEVCASGANASGPTRTAIYRSPGSGVDFTAEPVVVLETPSIAPGECETLAFELATSCERFEGTYAFGAVADYEDALPENNEGNNARSGDELLALSGTFCACVEDAYEPNNRPIDAAPLDFGTNALALCEPGSCDFFTVEALQEGESLVVTTRFDPAQGELSTRLFDPSGVQALDLDRGQDGTQQVATFLGAGGAYIIEVCATRPMGRNLYELEIDRIAPEPGVALLARRLTLPPQSSFSVGARLALTLDLYNLGLADSGPFEVELRISADETLDANDPLLATLSVENLPASTFEQLSAEVTLPTSLNEATYYIGALADPGATLNEVKIEDNIALSAPFDVVTLCYDPLEPNDAFDEAYPILGSGTFSNLLACSRAADYYEICVANGKRLEVTASFMGASGDIDLELYDSRLVKIDDSATQSDQEQVSVEYVNGAQCYTARVYMLALPGQPVAENLYELQVDISDVDPALLCASYGEPNDSFNEATSLLAASQIQSLDRCPKSDADYYFFDVGAVGQNFSITVSKAPSVQAGTLRMQLYTPNQTPDLNDETAPDQSTASISNYIAPQTGRYWLKITATGSQRNVTYTIGLTGLQGVDLAPENLVIGPGSYAPGEEVRLGFDLRNHGSQITSTPPSYEVYFSDSPTPNPALDTPLSAGAGFIASGDISASSAEAVALRLNVPSGAAPGTYYLHVVVEDMGDLNPGNNVATLPITITN